MSKERRGPSIGLVLLIFGVGAGSIGFFVLWLPSHRSSQRAANERSAAAFLKTLATAEADYRANDRDVNEGGTMRWRSTTGDPVLRWPSDEDMRHDWALGD